MSTSSPVRSLSEPPAPPSGSAGEAFASSFFESRDTEAVSSLGEDTSDRPPQQPGSEANGVIRGLPSTSAHPSCLSRFSENDAESNLASSQLRRHTPRLSDEEVNQTPSAQNGSTSQSSLSSSSFSSSSSLSSSSGSSSSLSSLTSPSGTRPSDYPPPGLAKTFHAASPSLDEIRARLRPQASSHPYAATGTARPPSQKPPSTFSSSFSSLSSSFSSFSSSSSFSPSSSPFPASPSFQPSLGGSPGDAPLSSPLTPTRSVFARSRSGLGTRLLSGGGVSASQTAPASFLEYLKKPVSRSRSGFQENGSETGHALSPSNAVAASLPSLLCSQTRTQTDGERDGLQADANGVAEQAEQQRKQRRGCTDTADAPPAGQQRDEEERSSEDAAALFDKGGASRETERRTGNFETQWPGARRLSSFSVKPSELVDEKRDFAIVAQELLAYLEVVEKFRQRAVEEASRLRRYSAELGAMLQQANQREEQSHRELARQHKVLTSCQARIQTLRADSETAINDLTLQRDTLAERLRVTSVELEHALKENERMRLERDAQEISVRDCRNIRKAYVLVEQEKKHLQKEVEALHLECSKSQSERNTLLAEMHHLQSQLGNIEETVSRSYFPSLEASASSSALGYPAQPANGLSGACVSSAAEEKASLETTAGADGEAAQSGAQTQAQIHARRMQADGGHAEDSVGPDDEVEGLLRDLLARLHAPLGERGESEAEAQDKSAKLLYLVRKLRSERNEYYGYAVELLNRLDAEKGEGEVEGGASGLPDAAPAGVSCLDTQRGELQLDL
ncbi:hypothetical protein TGCAST_309090 [Toxoplasma gondii CAST]|uniref:Uncharacterized protein n=1 Tax=Toxoplasma gondii CAST TaxID=943122 RepID=A0A3R8AR33_TOXGO|nr:hypothetical protein TGCAST_309090 [Toxoplasma gondii CAST]